MRAAGRYPGRRSTRSRRPSRVDEGGEVRGVRVDLAGDRQLHVAESGQRPQQHVDALVAADLAEEEETPPHAGLARARRPVRQVRGQRGDGHRAVGQGFQRRALRVGVHDGGVHRAQEQRGEQAVARAPLVRDGVRADRDDPRAAPGRPRDRREHRRLQGRVVDDDDQVGPRRAASHPPPVERVAPRQRRGLGREHRALGRGERPGRQQPGRALARPRLHPHLVALGGEPVRQVGDEQRKAAGPRIGGPDERDPHSRRPPRGRSSPSWRMRGWRTPWTARWPARPRS